MEDKVITPPVQARSRQTLIRIMDAAEALLEEKSWPDITIQEIVARADSSIGSFYARFENKELLLIHISERFSEQVEREAERLRTLTQELPAREYIKLAIAGLIRFHHKRRGIIRALTLVPRLDSSSHLEVDGRRNAAVFKGLAGRLAELSNDPVRARLGLFFISTAIREAIVFPKISDPLLTVDHQTLGEELSRALISYLES